MNATALIAGLESRGVRLTARGDRVDYKAPRGALKPGELDLLRESKPDVLAYLRARDLGVDWRKLGLWQVDTILEIAVPFSDVPLILAPGCRVARALRAQEPKPGRVWCVCEASDLLLANVPAEDAQKIGQARLMVGGTGVRVSHDVP